ncbi:MAG: hypothetical protein U0R49_01875 [Fimbriimonadales bacterium]
MDAGVCLWTIAGLFGLSAGLLAPREIDVFERAAAVEIGSRLQGEGKQVQVSVDVNGFAGAWGELVSAEISANKFSVDGLPFFTEPTRSKAGKLGVLRLRLSDFSLNGLDCDLLSADLVNCRYDFALALRAKKIRLSKSGTGPGFVRVNARALERFVLKKYHEIEEVTVELRGGKVIVEGVGNFLFSRSKFFVIASLVPMHGTQIHLSDAKIWLDGSIASDGASRALLQSLNPVIDENRDLNLHSALQMDRVTITQEYVELGGTARIPEIVNQ